MGFNDVPIDKFLAQDYRNTLRTASAPQNIDATSPIVPVIDIQKGFPRPNSKQILHNTYCLCTTAATFQVATKTSQNRIYFVGVTAYGGAAVDSARFLFDATSGTGPSPSVNTPYNDETGFFAGLRTTAIGQTQVFFPPLPYEIKYGIRVDGGGAGQNMTVNIYWIEEIV